ncbi:MAG: sigma-70 family RNA polymerase sigma factor [Saprospiraceae bacterium]|nr:sigma-70 family RNA polymerase sigma factor [Saprospiraceae bacterium]
MNQNFSQTIKKWFSGKPGRYADPGVLLDGLRRRDSAAIEYLFAKTEALVRRMVRESGMSRELVDNLLHDAGILVLEKIADGEFDPARSQPTTYLVAVCRNLLANELRKNSRRQTVSLDPDIDLPDDDWIRKMHRKEQAELIGCWLKKLGAPCSDLVRLKYLEGYSDQEQIDRQMTAYKSLDSLKSTRYQCMKKLSTIAENWKQKQHAS